MKKLILVLMIIVVMILIAVFFLLSCSNICFTQGNLKVKQTDSDSFKVCYSFDGVPKAVDNGQVYLNGEPVGSGAGSGVKIFDGVAPNTAFTLTTATITLATLVIHAR